MPAGVSDGAVNQHGVTVYVTGPFKIEGRAKGTVTPGGIVKRVLEDNEWTGELEPLAADDAANLAAGWASDNVSAKENETFNADGVAGWNDLRADYNEGELVIAPRNKGDRFMAILAASQTLDPDAVLHSAGSNQLKVGTAGTNDERVVARYLGTERVSTGAGETARILVEYLGGGA